MANLHYDNSRKSKDIIDNQGISLSHNEILLFKMRAQLPYMLNRLVNFIPCFELLSSHGKVDYGEIIMNVVI
jgi:hypothetical protein